MRKKIVVGVSGASGAPYARRLLGVLRQRSDVEIAVCVSQTAPEVWALECGGDLREQAGAPVFGARDYQAPFASGSAGWQAMVVVPCSMGTAARIAHGISDTLLTRAADVMLKERRRLVIVPRETPMSLPQLRNMVLCAEAGAMILPAMPAFYQLPKTLDDLADFIAGKILSALGFEHDLYPPWTGQVASP